jgi:hypothetical protein
MGPSHKAPSIVCVAVRIMLRKLTKEVTDCLERAADCRAKADATADPAGKKDFLAMEQRWLKTARTYRFTERLEDLPRARTTNYERGSSG